ncbi:hypothetical protein BRD00_06070 [Halobacteriales archaeon QS_8_69_26]|nr:MAG: hypothetical protein BRD00_06070 [Halobacteriales archaeon QS_8_69_26]
MELTRRDALAALAAAGAGVGAGVALRWSDGDPATREFRDVDRETLVALAEVVYPDDVSGIDGFVEAYVVGRVRDRPDRVAGIAEAVDRLDGTARDRFDAPFADLSPADRDAHLESLGVDAADPDPEGIVPERIRYYLVNDLLYALYTSPTGGRLVGIENPQGHPGGIDSSRRSGPEGSDGRSVTGSDHVPGGRPERSGEGSR